MPAHPLGRFRARVRPFTATVLVTLVAVATLAAAGLHAFAECLDPPARSCRLST